jgi:hypothetical protein
MDRPSLVDLTCPSTVPFTVFPSQPRRHQVRVPGDAAGHPIPDFEHELFALRMRLEQ